MARALFAYFGHACVRRNGRSEFLGGQARLDGDFYPSEPRYLPYYPRYVDMVEQHARVLFKALKQKVEQR